MLKTKEATSNAMLALIQANDMLKLLPEAIVDSRMHRNVTKLLVKWQFVPKVFSSWIDKQSVVLASSFVFLVYCL